MSRVVTLSWSNTSVNLTSQRIFSGTSADKLTLLKEIGAKDTSFVDSTVSQTDAETVYYQIVSVGTEDGKEVTALSEVITFTLSEVTVVNAPSGVTATEQDT